MGGTSESEIKYELAGAEDHRKFAAGLPTARDTLRQENCYLDTKDRFLSRQRIMLRLRRVGPAALLTFKSGAEVEAGYFVSREIEAGLENADAAAILSRPADLYRLRVPPVEEVRSRFGELPLEVVGSLITERTLYPVGGYVVELDRVMFPDGSEFFEVEVETDDPASARAWLEDQFLRLGVNASPSRLTKLARLLKK